MHHTLADEQISNANRYLKMVSGASLSAAEMNQLATHLQELAMTDSEKVIPERYATVYALCCNDKSLVLAAESYAQVIEELGAAEASLAMLEGALTCKNETVIELSAQQEAMRTALEKLARLGNGDHYGNSNGNVIAQECLAALSPQAAVTQDAQEKEAQRNAITGPIPNINKIRASRK